VYNLKAVKSYYVTGAETLLKVPVLRGCFTLQQKCLKWSWPLSQPTSQLR